MAHIPPASGETVEFIGDSITDCGRRQDPDGIGHGYVAIVRNLLAAAQPKYPLHIANRGVGGDRVTELVARWQEDALDVEPDWLSISIGVNDVWRAITPGREGEAVPLDRFDAAYRGLLERARGAGIRLALMEPTLMGDDLECEGNRIILTYVEAVRKMSEDFGAVLVPTHSTFRRIRVERPELQLTVDGVHPTPLGHTLMAVTWLRSMRLLDCAQPVSPA